LSEDLRRIEEAVERAVRRALAEARTEDLRVLAEAVKTLADYVREGFKVFQERFEKIDERFKEIEKRLSTLENNVKYLMSAVNEIKSALGVTMEDYTAVWLSRWLEEKGYKCDVRTRITIVVNPTTGDSREVDVICWNPLVVGEVTTTIRTVEEAEREIGKLLDSVAYAEKAAGAKHYAKILAVEIAPSEIAEYLERRARELDITLVLGRRY
jgi:phage host-nuclease inhibitor protein Gam